MISHLAELSADAKKAQGAAKTPFNVTLEVNLSFKRSTATGAMAVAITKDPIALQVALTEFDEHYIQEVDTSPA